MDVDPQTIGRGERQEAECGDAERSPGNLIR